jgi:hypothetical protein
MDRIDLGEQTRSELQDYAERISPTSVSYAATEVELGIIRSSA